VGLEPSAAVHSVGTGAPRVVSALMVVRTR
jgi:hypothetical protein